MNLTENIQLYETFIEQIDKAKLTDRRRNLSTWGNWPIDCEYLKPLYTIYRPGFKFLDLGCGVGNVLLFANNIGFDVFGVEISEKLCSHLSDYNHECNDISNLPSDFYFKFDVIYAYRTLKEGFATYVNEVISLMKPGAFIITPFFDVKNEFVKLVNLWTYQKQLIIK